MRHGGRVEPNLELKRFGLGGGWLTVTPEALSISVLPDQDARGLPNGHGDDYATTLMLDPDLAPLFRMIAKRLDALRRDEDV